MNKKGLLWVGILVVILIVIVASKKIQESKNVSAETIKVGMSVCQTGSCAEWGENEIKGAKLAVEKINSDPKNKKIELVLQDSQEDDVPKAILAYQKLRTDGINFIMTPTWTPAALALAPIVSKDDVVILAPSVGVRDYNEAGTNIFNTWPNDDEGSRYLARFVKSQGINSVAIISSKQPWEQIQGNAFADEFTKQGGTVTSKIEPQLTERDFKTYAAKIISEKPDAIFYSNLNNSGIAARDLKTLGFTGKQFAVLMDQTRLDQASGALDGTIYVQSPEVDKTFMEAFTTKYNEAPKVGADNAYDAIMWLSYALNKTNDLSPSNIASIMSKMKTLDNTANGTLKFNGKGAVLRDPALWIVNNGKLEKYNQ